MLNFYSTAFLSGFGTSFGLIVAIGAQNAFVLKQGILKNHVFLIALLCSFFDAGLITVGVLGLSAFLTSSELFMILARYGGAAFLGWYGLRSFLAARHKHVLIGDLSKKMGLKKTILMLTAFTFLNPHVYIDTFLVGSISTQFPEAQRFSFLIGAILASCTWFFSLTYGAKLLAPLFKKPLAWQILDTTTGLIMWSIALLLLFKL